MLPDSSPLLHIYDEMLLIFSYKLFLRLTINLQVNSLGTMPLERCQFINKKNVIIYYRSSSISSNESRPIEPCIYVGVCVLFYTIEMCL